MSGIFTRLLGFFIIGAFLMSCATKDKVVNKSFVQKRKYNKGFRINIKSPLSVHNKNVEVVQTMKEELGNDKVIREMIKLRPQLIEIKDSRALVKRINDEEDAEDDYIASNEVSISNEVLITTRSDSNIKSKDPSLKPVLSPKTMNQDRTTALLLAIFLGWLGIHRFYLGYVGVGIIQLLTMGGFLVWWIIDIINLSRGTLKPKKGDYSK